MLLYQRIRSKLSRESKQLFREVGHKLGFFEGFYKTARGSRILIYHGICMDNHTRFNPIFLKLETLEQHLKLYKKYFNVVSLDDYYQQKFSNDRFNICLTFDDGFANNCKYVLPLLEKYEMPATFFITGIRAAGQDVLWNDFLGIVSKYGPEKIVYKNETYYKGEYHKYTSTKNGVRLDEKLWATGFEEKAEMMKTLYPLVPFKTGLVNEDYWLQMSGEQIKELAKSPFATIGAHGYYHNDLAQIDINSAVTELEQTKLYLENIIEKPVTSFAFPYGAYTPQVVDATKKTGYKQLLATDFLFKKDADDASMRERFTVNPFISANNQMYATITGNYDH